MIETNGTLSAALRPEKEPARLADLQLKVTHINATIPFVLLRTALDGNFIAAMLTILGYSLSLIHISGVNICSECIGLCHDLLSDKPDQPKSARPARGANRAHIPVSYTHLDVYKRQDRSVKDCLLGKTENFCIYFGQNACIYAGFVISYLGVSVR